MIPLRTLLAPRQWGAHLLMVVVVSAAVALGLWQYGNSQRAKEAQVDDLVHAEPRSLSRVMGPNDAFPGRDLGRPVVIEGRWDDGATVLVSGQRHAGRDGFWVASPVLVDGTDSALYVVRGWAASASDVPAPPTGKTRVLGWLQPPQQDAVSDDDPDDEVLPQLDITLLLNRTDRDLYSAYAVGAGEEEWAAEPVNDGSTGLAPVAAPDPPEPDPSTGLRNLLYAIEWWLFGVLGLYIWWRHLRDVTRDAASGPEQEAGEEQATDQPVPSGS